MRKPNIIYKSNSSCGGLFTHCFSYSTLFPPFPLPLDLATPWALPVGSCTPTPPVYHPGAPGKTPLHRGQDVPQPQETTWTRCNFKDLQKPPWGSLLCLLCCHCVTEPSWPEQELREVQKDYGKANQSLCPKQPSCALRESCSLLNQT